MLLLHLSDIHFRKGEVGSAMDPNAHLRNELVRDAESMCARLAKTPSVILVSGDIAFAGHQDEYAFAQTWLDELCARCGTTLESVFVIPGNHDVVRDVASRPIIQSLHNEIKRAGPIGLEGVIRGLLTDDETKRLLYDALAPFNAFALQFFCDLLPPERTIARRDLILNDGSTLRISGFNSAYVSSKADQKTDLFVDPACFALKRERGVEHLVLCHHPFAWLRQGDELKDYLNDVARIHLFGHEHTNRVEPGRDWLRIAASAAHPDKTEPGWEPGYNLINVSIETEGDRRTMLVKSHVRVWQQRPGEFRGKTYRGEDPIESSFRLETWSPPAAPAPQAQPDRPAQRDLAVGRVVDYGTMDVMDTLRNISVRFFKLSLSQKSAIAGSLSLLEDEDASQPDFERFRRVFIRARDRGLIEALDKAIAEATSPRR